MQPAPVYRQTTHVLVALLIGAALTSMPRLTLRAQEGPVNLAVADDDIENGDPANAEVADTAPQTTSDFNLLDLVLKGGVLMIPIAAMSILVITLVIERSLSLRERKVLPRGLVNELGNLANSRKGFDPRQAYRICQSFPSAASTVIRAMLLKVGRPHAEVEHAVAEASDREASRLYSHVRWLNLAAAVTPLMGLFGTVWGMIRAFFDTTQLQAGQNKADFLAEGIYVALVTTLGGLAVAIPAAIFSHYFEGRIQSLFFRIDDLLFNLMPQIERYEGRLRMNRQTLAGGIDDIEAAPEPSEPPRAPPADAIAAQPTR